MTLLEAHDVLVGDEGTPIPNWSTDRPVTEWTGIALGGDTPRVTDITLSHVFNGRIPPGLARLDRLRTLNLWNNELTGEIPREVGLLLDLQVLDVGSFETRDSGGLTGRIPPELGARTCGSLAAAWAISSRARFRRTPKSLVRGLEGESADR